MLCRVNNVKVNYNILLKAKIYYNILLKVIIY